MKRKILEDNENNERRRKNIRKIYDDVDKEKKEMKKEMKKDMKKDMKKEMNYIKD